MMQGKIKKFITFASFIFLISGTISAASEEIPVLNYKNEFGQDGQLIVGNLTDQKSDTLLLMGWDDALIDKSHMENGKAWVVIDEKGLFKAAALAGNTDLLRSMLIGETMQVVPVNDLKLASFGGPTLIDMDKKVREQLRVAANAFREEACATMKNWDQFKFGFELGASAVVEAKIIAEGSFTPSKVC